MSNTTLRDRAVSRYALVHTAIISRWPNDTEPLAINKLANKARRAYGDDTVSDADVLAMVEELEQMVDNDQISRTEPTAPTGGDPTLTDLVDQMHGRTPAPGAPAPSNPPAGQPNGGPGADWLQQIGNVFDQKLGPIRGQVDKNTTDIATLKGDVSGLRRDVNKLMGFAQFTKVNGPLAALVGALFGVAAFLLTYFLWIQVVQWALVFALIAFFVGITVGVLVLRKKVGPVGTTDTTNQR